MRGRGRRRSGRAPSSLRERGEPRDGKPRYSPSPTEPTPIRSEPTPPKSPMVSRSESSSILGPSTTLSIIGECKEGAIPCPSQTPGFRAFRERSTVAGEPTFRTGASLCSVSDYSSSSSSVVGLDSLSGSRSLRERRFLWMRVRCIPKSFAARLMFPSVRSRMESTKRSSSSWA